MSANTKPKYVIPDAARFLRGDLALPAQNVHPRQRLESVRQVFRNEDVSLQKGRISLAEGGSLYAPPASVLEGFIDAALQLDKYPTQIYPQQNALPAFIDRIWDYFSRECGIPLNGDEHGVVFGFGCAHLFDLFLSVVGEAGKIILMPGSYYHSFAEWPAKWGVEPMIVRTSAENNFKITAADLKRWCTENPQRVSQVCCLAITNPTITGAIYSRADLEELAEVVAAHDFLVFSDEVFHDTAFEGKSAISTAQIPLLAGRTVTASSGSKARSAAEVRIGWACGPKRIVDAMIHALEHSVIGIPLYLQAIGLSILNMDHAFIQESARECANRAKIISELVAHSNIRLSAAFPDVRQDIIRIVAMPEAGHYICLDFNALLGWKTPQGQILQDSRDLFRYFYYHAHEDEKRGHVQHGVSFSCGYSRGHDGLILYTDFAQSGYERAASQAQDSNHRHLTEHLLRQVAKTPLSEEQVKGILETLGLAAAPKEIDYEPVRLEGHHILIEAFDRVVCALRMLEPPAKNP